VVRTTVDPTSVASAGRNAIRAVNPDSAPTPRTFDTVMAESLARQRFQMETPGAFAVLALLLAAVGLYGVMSYIVTANRAEIGIRLALGAQPSLMFRLITGRALALAAADVALGTLGCLAVRRVPACAELELGVGLEARLHPVRPSGADVLPSMTLSSTGRLNHRVVEGYPSVDTSSLRLREAR
jgi:hypothetical protein